MAAPGLPRLTSKAYPPSSQIRPLPSPTNPPLYLLTQHNPDQLLQLCEASQVDVHTWPESSFVRAANLTCSPNPPRLPHRAHTALAPQNIVQHKAPKHTLPSSAWLQIVHWMHWVSEARVAAPATAARRPPPPRTNRSLPGGGRFMKWGRWEGEGRWSVEEEEWQGRGEGPAHQPLPFIPPSPELWHELWSWRRGGGGLYLGWRTHFTAHCTLGPLLTHQTALMHPVSSDYQLIPTSTYSLIFTQMKHQPLSIFLVSSK